MTQDQFFADLPKGWEAYQQLLIDALRLLSADELALRLNHDLRSAGSIAAHIVGARVRWLREVLGEGGEELDRWAHWDREGAPIPSGAELAQALEDSWQPLKAGLERWQPRDYAQVITVEEDGQEESMTRGWVVWHLIEHDLHHGGELSFLLGSHGLRGVEIL
jgi:uncharacterized damage-inducible protein DinB